MLGAVYIPPKSRAFPRAQVTDSFLALADELSRASQVTPHFLLCSDLNAKLGGLNKVTHAHKSLLVAHPARAVPTSWHAVVSARPLKRLAGC